ncbi:MAG: tyrosine--tRNA ligase [Candidatus Kapabacteria bacterium]|jgi:tyrosyl-tRNA synthetase|nr:tyrosine--tRNA ligase [Candidatus Kapabacteria bacterium]
MFLSVNEQMDIIRQNTAEIIPEDELAQKIEKSAATNNPLIVKFGCDPSRPDLHIGHAVVLRKMRQFQDLGHNVILIIGDFTGMIGDPTGKSKTRPPLTLDQTRENGQSYVEQAMQVLSKERLRIVHNSDWLGTMTFQDVIGLSAKYTVAQMLERDDFTKRYKAGEPISLHEFLYPLAQAMDSVMIKSDIELGGSDQKFNLLVGRELQRVYGQNPQCILTMPILEGTDGVEKMSKSLDNYIGLTDSPREIFGRVMSIPDTMITRYMKYGAWLHDTMVKEQEQQLSAGTLHPRNAKVFTAMKIVELYHGSEAAQAAFEEFERIFVKKDIPDEIEEITVTLPAVANIVDIIIAVNLAASKGEARRLIQQGGVSIDGVRITDPALMTDISSRRLLKVGKRTFVYITAESA